MVDITVTYSDVGGLEPSHIRNEMKAAESDWGRLAEGIWNSSRQVKSLSLLAGYVAGEVYSIYAVFYTHALIPVSAYLAKQGPHLSVVSGKYHEVFDLSGVLPVLVTSLMTFALAWCVVRGTALALSSSELGGQPGAPSRQPREPDARTFLA
jgi:hypothetical protein